MAHTVIPPPRGTAATLDLTHKGNINDKTIPERDREVRDFNVTLLLLGQSYDQIFQPSPCTLVVNAKIPKILNSQTLPN